MLFHNHKMEHVICVPFLMGLISRLKQLSGLGIMCTTWLSPLGLPAVSYCARHSFNTSEG